MPNKLRRFFETLVFAFAGLMVATALAWGLLALVNFSYPLWHDYGGIGDAIEHYGGENRYKSAFDETTREQRFDLFEGINRAIHRDGEGLAELSYQVPGHPPQQLLREPEVVHLQDVAHLVTLGKDAAVAMLLLWLGCGVLFIKRGCELPSLKHQVAVILSLVGFIGLVVFAVGPVRVFYVMHEWVFPPGHEWFFYYQDSLMSTMMFAPVLFGYIAVEWLVLTLLLFVLLQLAAAKVCKAVADRRGYTRGR